MAKKFARNFHKFAVWPTMRRKVHERMSRRVASLKEGMAKYKRRITVIKKYPQFSSSHLSFKFFEKMGTASKKGTSNLYEKPNITCSIPLISSIISTFFFLNTKCCGKKKTTKNGHMLLMELGFSLIRSYEYISCVVGMQLVHFF